MSGSSKAKFDTYKYIDMRKIHVVLGLCLAACVVKAQTVTPTVYSNQGGYNVAAGGDISWTVGEPVSETYTNTTKMTTMGFHQPELGVATLIKEQGNDKQILVYPNPVINALTISFKDLDNGVYKMELFDDLGRSVYKAETEIKADSKLVQLNMAHYAAGNYYLRIANPTINKSIKVTKTY
jgi:hypothetical protein